MPITYTVDSDRAIIFEHWSGTVSANELGTYWKHILSDPEVMAIRRTVVDLREATIGFMGWDLEQLIDSVVTPVMKGRTWVTALITGHPVQVGISNQYSVFASHYSKEAIFADPDAAAAWVLAQPRPE